jgi:hypothetical protein
MIPSQKDALVSHNNEWPLHPHPQMFRIHRGIIYILMILGGTMAVAAG